MLTLSKILNESCGWNPIPLLGRISQCRNHINDILGFEPMTNKRLIQQFIAVRACRKMDDGIKRKKVGCINDTRCMQLYGFLVMILVVTGYSCRHGSAWNTTDFFFTKMFMLPIWTIMPTLNTSSCFCSRVLSQGSLDYCSSGLNPKQ